MTTQATSSSTDVAQQQQCVMLQVYIGFLEERADPTVPVLLRLNMKTSTVREVIHLALLRLRDAARLEQLPYNYTNNYVVRVCLGDGSPNTTVPAIPHDTFLEECCDAIVTFPYMVHLSARQRPPSQLVDPLPEPVLAAYGLPATAAPRPLPAELQKERDNYLNYAGLSEEDVNKYGPRSNLLVSDADEVARAHKAMIARRREDTIVKKLRRRSRQEELALARCEERDRVAREKMAADKAELQAQQLREQVDPLYAVRVRHERDVARVRHKLQSDISRGVDLLDPLDVNSNIAEGGTAGGAARTPLMSLSLGEVHNSKNKPATKHTPPRTAPTSLEASSADPSPFKAQTRRRTLDNIVARLDAAVLMETVEHDERMRKERARRRQLAIEQQATRAKADAEAVAKRAAEEKKREEKKMREMMELKAKQLSQRRVETHRQRSHDTTERFGSWKAKREASMGPAYARAMIKFT
eukprot:PhM_4_TR18707/c1_g1_i1/m.7930